MVFGFDGFGDDDDLVEDVLELEVLESATGAGYGRGRRGIGLGGRSVLADVLAAEMEAEILSDFF